MAETEASAPSSPAENQQTSSPAATPATPATPSKPAAAAPPATPPAAQVNALEKFKVAKADGTIDHQATMEKMLRSYVHLERRFRSGDIPPETEEGYKLDYAAFPPEVKISQEGEKALLKSLHGAGMTNKQVQTVMNKYGEVIKQGLEIQKTQEAAKISETLAGVETDLKTSWSSGMDANVRAAVRGFNHLADGTDKADIEKIGKDARVTYRVLMKVLAKVGAGLAEDEQVLNAEGVGINGTLEELRNSKAYADGDPATVAKVTALYRGKYVKK